MEQRDQNKKKRSDTRIIPPKGKAESLSRDEVRSIKKKKIRRRRKLKRIALLLFLAVAVISIGVVLVLTVFFRIGTVKVDGKTIYTNEEIILKSGIKTGENMFMIDSGELNETLTSDLPYIKAVTLERELPDTVILKVSTTKAVAAFKWGEGYVLIDETGKVLERSAAKVPKGVAVVTGAKLSDAAEGAPVNIGEGTTEELVKVLKSIKSSELTSVTGIEIAKNGEFRLRYDNRITIKLGTTDNIDIKLKRAVVSLEKENEINPYSEGVLDLRTDGYAYFKPGEEVSTTLPVPVTDEYGYYVKPTESTSETETEADNGEASDDEDGVDGTDEQT